jgi:hypothetical protein
MTLTRTFAPLCALALALAAGQVASETVPGLRVRALGCFFGVPASYTLIADPGTRIEFIAPLATGSVAIEPFSEAVGAGLSRVSSRTEGHLTILELTDHDAREPLQLTVIHNRLQAVSLVRSARELALEIVAACLANTHPRAPRAPAEQP